MPKQITSGPTWRKYDNNTGAVMGWVFLFFGVFFGAVMMFRPPDSQGVPPGPRGSILAVVLFWALAAACFPFHAYSVVDHSKGCIELFRGWGNTHAVGTFPLAEFRGIVVGRAGTRGGSASYRLMLDRGPQAVQKLVLITFDRKPDAQAEAKALSELIGLPVIQPETDPLAYSNNTPS